MGEVVELPKRWTAETCKVFTCGCGGQEFHAHIGGELVCVDCSCINTPLLVCVREGFKMPESE
jgi:hypothetical protein